MTTRVRSFQTPFSSTGAMRRQAMTDVVTPEFFKRRNSGELVCNPATSMKIEIAALTEFGFKAKSTRPGYPTSYATLKNKRSYAWRPYNQYGWANNWLESSMSAYLSSKEEGFDDVSEHAIAQAHTDISARLGQGIASILVTVAEARKTRDMFATALTLLRRPIKDVMAIGKRMTGKQRVDTVNNWWLEGRYGWRPFIYDVMDGYEASTTEARQRLTKLGQIPVWETSEKIVDASYGWNGLLTNVNREILCQGFVGLGQTGDFLAALSGGYRKWGGYDLVGAAWDLVPYSFVADWFCNVGAALGALQVYALLNERIGWTKYVRKCTSTLEHVVIEPGPLPWGYSTVQIVETYGDKADHVFFESWDRRVRTGFLPVLGARMDLDWKKVIDLAALLRGQWNRCRRG